MEWLPQPKLHNREWHSPLCSPLSSSSWGVWRFGTWIFMFSAHSDFLQFYPSVVMQAALREISWLFTRHFWNSWEFSAQTCSSNNSPESRGAQKHRWQPGLAVGIWSGHVGSFVGLSVLIYRIRGYLQTVNVRRVDVEKPSIWCHECESKLSLSETTK